MDPLDDLVDAARKGDRAALDELLRLQLPGLRAFIRLQCGPLVHGRESHSDIAQSVCREVLEHLDRFQSGGAAGFRSWLYTTAMRKIRNRAAFWNADRRREGVRGAPAHDPDDGLLALCRSITSPSEVVAGHELIARVERAFDRLTEPEREVILLSRVLGLSHAELAQQIGKSEGASRVFLHRALGRLAGLLDVPAGGAEA